MNLWLYALAFLGDRQARITLNRQRGARKAAVTRRERRSMAVKVADEPIASRTVITERTTLSGNVSDSRD